MGMPHSIALDEYGSQVWWAFGEVPYLVGSALEAKDGWRDVDVRLILDDEEWDRLGLGPTVLEGALPLGSGKWRALCWAFSLLGREMTGLPIDFQIQRRSEANEKYPGPRSAIGLVPLRFAPTQKSEGGAE